MNMRLVGILAAVSAVCAGAASAQDAPGAAALDQCMADARDRDGEEACLYIVNDACLDETGDQTTIGMSECLQVETQVWDDRLNALWPEALAMAQELDAEDMGGGATHEESLLAAQRAWIAFRDAECDWAYTRWSGGTIRTLMAGSCLLEMSAHRVLDFRDWLRRGG